jgi:stearoyl-CoA desaturase (delta-9 desaturase)
MSSTGNAIEPIQSEMDAASPIATAVVVANEDYRNIERRIALAVVIIPTIGALAAILLLWREGLGQVALLSLVIMYSLGIIGIGVGYHRYFTHRGFQTKRPIRMMLAILGSMAAQGPVLYWVAIHRRHHTYSDLDGDPHSPNLQREQMGALHRFWHAHTGWLFVHEVTTWGHYIPDLLRDKTLFKINQLYFFWVFLGLAFPAIGAGLYTGTWMGALQGFLWGGLIRIFFGHHTTWSVNSICHLWGSRPFESRDMSRNNFWLALSSFGESWHNNHHAFPTSARHGLEWWQIDLSGLLIQGLKLSGLAWNVKVPTGDMMEKARRSKGDTL